jgi:hypothetical protein
MSAINKSLVAVAVALGINDAITWERVKNCVFNAAVPFTFPPTDISSFGAWLAAHGYGDPVTLEDIGKYILTNPYIRDEYGVLEQDGQEHGLSLLLP